MKVTFTILKNLLFITGTFLRLGWYKLVFTHTL